MLPKKNRLTTALFDQVFAGGKLMQSERFWIRSFLLPANSPNRFAMAVSKKVAPKATDRNAIKRRLYRAIDKISLPHTHGTAFIIGVKSRLSEVSFDDIVQELNLQLKKVQK